MEFTEIIHKWLHNSIIKIFKNHKISKESAILDIWCGNGNFLHKLSILWYNNLNGCDGFLENKKITDIAKFKKQNLNEPLVYEDNSIDIVILTEVIEHLENPNDLLKEVHRVLKKWWVVLLSTPNIHTLVSRLLFLFAGKLFQFTYRDATFTDFPGHIAPFFPHIFKEIFKDMFRVTKTDYSNFIMPVTWREFPIKNKLFGNTIILTIKKI